jgi:type I restriction enzyme S subunit
VSKWEEVVLDKICETITDGTHNTPPLVEMGVPLFNGADINNMRIHNDQPSKYISKETDNFLAKRCKPWENDVLISSRGSIGKIAIVENGQDFNIMGNIILCRPKPEKLLPWFLGYFLVSNQKKIEAFSHGVAQKGLYLSMVRELKVPLPDIRTQKLVTEVLDTASELIAKHKQQLADLDNLINSIFYDMFGDPITNEKGWQSVSLTDVIVLQRGFDLPVQNRLNNGDIPVYGSNGVLDYHIVSKVKNGGVITGRSGTIGKVFYTFSDYWPLNTTLFSADLKGNNIVFLAYMLQYLNLERFCSGTGVPTLNRNIVHNEKIYKVPLPLQNQFATIVAKIEEQKAQVKQAIDETQQLFDSLMSQYFG